MNHMDYIRRRYNVPAKREDCQKTLDLDIDGAGPVE